jgi:alpha-L-fucosidase 2
MKTISLKYMFLIPTLYMFSHNSVHAKREPWTTTRLDGYDRQAVFQNTPKVVGDATTLWFNRPASKWEQAFPIGNGTLGAMVFGGIKKDVIQFNHLELWLPPSVDDKYIFKKLPNKEATLKKVRELLFAGKTFEAHQIISKELLVRAKNRFQGMGAFTTFALLNFDYNFKEGAKEIDGYVRSLDMSTGLTHTKFTLGKTTYERETFITDDLNVIAIRMRATGPGTISTSINLSRPVNFPHQTPKTGSIGSNGIFIKGTAQGEKISPYATSYGAVARAFATGGTIESKDGIVSISNAREFLIILSGTTNFNKDDPFSPLARDLVMDSDNILSSFQKIGSNELRAAAIQAHSSLFNRVHLRLGPEKKNLIPTDERLKRSSTMNGITKSNTLNYDGLLDSQLFQLGRYILITSARGEMGPPLPGLWSPELMPMWSGDYHHNINTQMYYWPAEVANLSECHESYFGMMERELPSGKKLASEMFGCRGAAVGVLNGMHQAIFPSLPPRAFWLMGGVWQATHIMDHYRFGGDRDFLEKRGYPILREHVLFCLDWMVINPETGKLVLGPDVSPENTFANTQEEISNKQFSHEDMGCAMDQQLAWQLLNDFLEAADILGVQDDLVLEVQAALPKLETTHLTADGRIREWSRDYIDNESTHRHVSHLFGLYPGYQFNTDNAPKMIEAAKKTLAVRSQSDRGAGKIGWSISWMAALYARFYDAEKCFEYLIRYHSEKVIHPNLMSKGGNALEQCNGYTAAIAEMLLQSHRGEIELLPTLPKVWSEGEVQGLVARGGFEVSMTWKNSMLVDASILSKQGNPCKIRYKDKKISLKLNKGEKKNVNKALGL